MSRTPLDRLEPALPGAWFHDPVHYARELEAFWYPQSLILLRRQNGAIGAVHNVCRHRGSVLCTKEHGHFERNRIVCPYHAWTYDLAGELVAMPRRMETPDFDMKRFPLHPANVRTRGGFVFVNLEGRPSFTPPKGLENYGLAGLRIGKRIVADVKANWKLLCENFSECFHCPPVHPELCRGLDPGLSQKPEYRPAPRRLPWTGRHGAFPFAI